MRVKKNIVKCKCFLLLIFLLCSVDIYSQRVAVKTNGLYWLTLSPNIGGEFVLSDHLSLDVGVAFNPFRISDLQLKFVQVQPELRYWFGRPMSQHYVGITAFYADNKSRFKDNMYYGDSFAGGVTYGYAWILGKRWNLEAFAGIGYLHYRQFKYPAGGIRPGRPNKKGGTVAPVKFGVSIVYIIR